jgi:hypothetical protein
VPAGLGCLVAIVALPLAILGALFAVLRALVRPPARGAHTGPRPVPTGAAAADTALCEFVRKMSLDESFDLTDARTAGLPPDRGVTVEGLIRDGLARGWLEQRGDRYAVTPRGRSDSETVLRQRGL